MAGVETGVTPPINPPDETVKSSRWSVNRRLLPLKMFYFFFYGACGTVIPFIPVYLKYLNVTASEIGIITGVAVLLCIFIRPALGMLADKLNVRKPALIFSCLVFGSAFFAMWFIPMRVPATDASKSRDFVWACPDHMAARNRSRYLDLEGHSECLSTTSVKEPEMKRNKHDVLAMTDSGNLSHSEAETHPPLRCYYVIRTHSNTSSSGYQLHSLYASISHDKPRNDTLSESCLKSCSKISSANVTRTFGNEVTIRRAEESEKPAVTLDAVFVVSFALLALSRAFYSSSTSLADAVTYTVLGNDRLKWGEQRLWGSIGTACAILFVSTVNERLQGHSSYIALFITCLLLTGLACVVGIVKLNCDGVPKNERFLQDIWSVLKSGAVRVYFGKLILFGMLCGAAQNFFLWFIVDIGASQINLGLLLLTNCFASVVLLRFTRKVLELLGQQRTMYFVLVCYSVRYLAFSLIPLPWFAIPIELLHGVTYSVFWAAASATASLVAPPGTQSTCQGLAGAIYWDMGRGLGTVITGQLIDLAGPRMVFRCYSIGCVAFIPVCCFFDRIWSLKATPKSDGKDVENGHGQDSKDDPNQHSSSTRKFLDSKTSAKYVEKNNKLASDLTLDISTANDETSIKIHDNEKELLSSKARHQDGVGNVDVTLTSESTKQPPESHGLDGDVNTPLLENNALSQTPKSLPKETSLGATNDTVTPPSFQILPETASIGDENIRQQ